MNLYACLSDGSPSVNCERAMGGGRSLQRGSRFDSEQTHSLKCEPSAAFVRIRGTNASGRKAVPTATGFSSPFVSWEKGGLNGCGGGVFSSKESSCVNRRHNLSLMEVIQ